MDAVVRYWQVLRALVLARPFILFVLALFYLLAGFLTLASEPGKKASIIAIMSAIPACGVFAIATQRIIEYTVAASALGIPRHSESLRVGQLWLVGIFVGIPASVAAAYGGDLSYVVLLLVPAASGVLLAIYSRWVFLIWIVVAVTTRFSYSFGAWMPGLSNPWIRAILVGLSLIVLYWWLGLANRIAQRSLGASLLMADVKHELSTASIGEALGADPGQYELYEKAYDRGITAIVAGVTDSSITKRALQIGLAMPGRTNPRLIAIMTAICLAALLFFHLRNPRTAELSAYLGFSLLAAMSLFGQLMAVMEAWKARATEEALLVLTPRWPPQSQVKRLFLQIALERQSGTWAVWLLVSLPAWFLGWIESKELVTSVLIMVAAGCGASGTLLLVLSRKVLKEVSLLTIVSLLCGAGGAVVYLFGSAGMAHAQIVGVGMILVPLAVGALSFATRPLQFPVQIVSKQ
jgi:hypothetical protein